MGNFFYSIFKCLFPREEKNDKEEKKKIEDELNYTLLENIDVGREQKNSNKKSIEDYQKYMDDLIRQEREKNELLIQQEIDKGKKQQLESERELNEIEEQHRNELKEMELEQERKIKEIKESQKRENNRVDLRRASAEPAEHFVRQLASAQREHGVAVRPADALHRRVVGKPGLLEGAVAVGAHHLRPLVPVVPRGVSAGEDVRERAEE